MLLEPEINRLIFWHRPSPRVGLPATCVIQYVNERWGGLQFRFKRI